MRVVHIEASTAYDVVIGSGLIDEAGLRIAEVIAPTTALIVTDDCVEALFADRVQASLESAGFTVRKYVFPNGERSKTLATLSHMLDHMSAIQLTKTDIVICLGGGVVGDMGGFAAAVYARGIRFVQIPTTLLAAVDSSVGGKTAVNLSAAKNMAGAFAQPSLVLCDVDVLKALPEHLIGDGAGEVVKYGVLEKGPLLEVLMEGKLIEQMEAVVGHCVEIKRDYVQADEFDRGKRQLLNLGHTIGHAVEKCSHYEIPHGRAVAIGLMAIARAAWRLGFSQEDCTAQIARALAACHLPDTSPFGRAALLEVALMDKKRSGSEIALAVPVSIGQCEMVRIKTTELGRWIEAGIDAERTLHRGALRGDMRAIPSKSDVHRQLILAALCDKPTRLVMGALSDDIEATIRCLEALGAAVERTDDGLLVSPITKPVSGASLDCGESGSTLRFMLPLIFALDTSAKLTARGRLIDRPNAALLDALRAHGACIVGETPPFDASGTLKPGEYLLPGDVSSQYATGLLMALPLLDAPSEIIFTSPAESQGYIDLTVQVMARYGLLIERTERGYRIPAPQRYMSPGTSDVEGDWSNAAFFLAANALGSDVRILGLREDSIQADRAIVELIGQCQTPGDREIDVSGCPDLVPILAVLATQSAGETRIINAARLRLKESDRLQAMRMNLQTLGASVRELPDGLVIRGPQTLHAGTVDSFNDHRIAMAMSIAATVADGTVTLRDADAVNKSYPGFFEDLAALG